MTEEMLKKVQKIQLDMCLEVKRICEKNNIAYFLEGGTMLGAVRHKGVIPWDDDLDIAMLREDYNKFIIACKHDLDNKYFLQNWDSDKGYGLFYSKLRLNGTTYTEYNSMNTKTHKGVFIDIFVFDNSPDDIKKKELQKRKTYIYKRLILTKLKYSHYDKNSIVKRIVYLTLGVILKMTPLNYLKNKLIKYATMANHNKTEYMVNVGSPYSYDTVHMPCALLKELGVIEFNGHNLSCIKDADTYLKQMYGDYMTMPPEDKRYNRHKVVKIDLGKYN